MPQFPRKMIELLKDLKKDYNGVMYSDNRSIGFPIGVSSSGVLLVYNIPINVLRDMDDAVALRASVRKHCRPGNRIPPNVP